MVVSHVFVRQRSQQGGDVLITHKVADVERDTARRLLPRRILTSCFADLSRTSGNDAVTLVNAMRVFSCHVPFFFKVKPPEYHVALFFVWWTAGWENFTSRLTPHCTQCSHPLSSFDHAETVCSHLAQFPCQRGCPALWQGAEKKKEMNSGPYLPDKKHERWRKHNWECCWHNCPSKTIKLPVWLLIMTRIRPKHVLIRFNLKNKRVCKWVARLFKCRAGNSSGLLFASFTVMVQSKFPLRSRVELCLLTNNNW